MGTLTVDQYADLLLERQAAHIAANPPAKPWLIPLLEWFIEPGDEALFTPPTEARQPRPERTPRTYRTAASLTEERDRLITKRDPLAAPIITDRAASHGVALGPKRTAKVQAQQDSRLRRYVELTHRIDALEDRIKRARAREDRARRPSP